MPESEQTTLVEDSPGSKTQRIEGEAKRAGGFSGRQRCEQRAALATRRLHCAGFDAQRGCARGRWRICLLRSRSGWGRKAKRFCKHRVLVITR